LEGLEMKKIPRQAYTSEFKELAVKRVGKPKRGRKPLFDPAIFEERFRTIERVFAWEDNATKLVSSTAVANFHQSD